MNNLPRIVSGMRPTGPLHLGHFFGVLVNWLELQKNNECFFFIADWHALTSEYTNPHRIKDFVPELLKDWLAIGLDPEKSIIFQQSQVKAHAELHMLLSMLTPLTWLERNPTYKEIRQELVQKDLNTYGFLGYPVLMSADILLYFPSAVPVGQDQLPHLELTREIARRFNYINGDTFPEPKAVLTNDAKLLGLDGRKMSKSYGNSIALSEPLDAIRPKIMSMLTDTNRTRKTDAGDPHICNLYPYHELLTDKNTCAEIVDSCKNASIGCVDCKKILINSMEAFLAPIQEKRAVFDADKDLLLNILHEGNAKANKRAEENIILIREKLSFNF